eukprot:6787467-Pyramimonas_sp.AAC.1
MIHRRQMSKRTGVSVWAGNLQPLAARFALLSSQSFGPIPYRTIWVLGSTSEEMREGGCDLLELLGKETRHLNLCY